jgi:hypothetical protein
MIWAWHEIPIGIFNLIAISFAVCNFILKCALFINFQLLPASMPLYEPKVKTEKATFALS